MKRNIENPTWFIDQMALYQNANSSAEVVKRNFLVRTAEFELIIEAMSNKEKGDPLQHELILGRRGSGKSTLLRRLQIEIDEQKELSAKYIAINLAEEQNAIYRLSDLWFEVLQELSSRYKDAVELKDFDTFESNHEYSRYLYAHIHRILHKNNKQVVLLLDNLDRILENFADDAHLLRETLLNHSDIQIIGGSTRMNEHFWRYDQPFYEFFRRHRLEGLTFDEIHALLNHWSEEMSLPQLKDYAMHHRGRVEAIRILTDGLPRALQFFIQVLLHDSELYGFDYLRKVMDKATPLYQERLNNLTPPQRKIVQALAFHWEAASTKTLVETCRMESKKIAAFLKQLDHFGIVETIHTDKKNHLYALSERFFNMWLIVTQGNPEQKRKAKYLTLFLETWYDKESLQLLAKQHITDLMEKNMPYDKAILLSKGLAQSKFIGVEERDALIDYTLAIKPKGYLNSELPRKFSDVIIEIAELLENGNYEKALEKLNEIENDGNASMILIRLFCQQKLFKFSESEDDFIEELYFQLRLSNTSTNYGYEEKAIHPKLALALVRVEHSIFNDQESNQRLIIAEIRNGIFENLANKVKNTIELDTDLNMSWFLTNLLSLHQVHLILNLFERSEHSKMLQERYQLLYWATLILAGKAEANLLLRIPKEVMPTVERIVADVRKQQDFYSKKAAD